MSLCYEHITASGLLTCGKEMEQVGAAVQTDKMTFNDVKAKGVQMDS